MQWSLELLANTLILLYGQVVGFYFTASFKVRGGYVTYFSMTCEWKCIFLPSDGSFKSQCVIWFEKGSVSVNS